MPKSQSIKTFVSDQIRALRFIVAEGAVPSAVPKWLRRYAICWISWSVTWVLFCFGFSTLGFIGPAIFMFVLFVVVPYIPIYKWWDRHQVPGELSGKEAKATITRLDQLNDQRSEIKKARTLAEPQDSAHLQPYAKPPKPKIEPPIMPEPIHEPAPVEPESGIHITSSFGYKGAKIIYKIKVENHTVETVGDIKVRLFVPEVFLLKENGKHIGLLKPKEAQTVTFEIRPTGECGDCEISGHVTYYDYAGRKTKEADIPSKSLSIVCPMLRAKEIDKSNWKDTVNRLIQAEEGTEEIQIPAETLFTMVARVIEDMNMYRLEPEVSSTPILFNGVARFYAEGVKEFKYAAQIEVVGGAKKSKLILKAWAEREEALTGFYHGILDEIEKRIQVKGYIEDSIVQHFYHIGTVVKDSVVQRSTIGASAGKKCPNCGREVSKDEKFCADCGARLN